MVRRPCDPNPGFTILELLLAIGIAGTLAAMAVPQSLRALDDYRTRSAAQFLARKLGTARFQAIRRSATHGLWFREDGSDYRLCLVSDANGNGLRTAELRASIDQTLTEPEPLDAHFAGVHFGILAGVPDADGAPAAGSDGVRFGASKIASMNGDGTASSGTLYVNGAGRSQYAVRILGSTGRVRILKFDPARWRWVAVS